MQNSIDQTKSSEAEIRDFYNSSDLYFNICENRTEASFRNLIDVVVEYVPKNAKLLEFGCGTGNLANMISAKSYRVTGVDISEKFIDYAKTTYANHQSDLTFQTVNFGRLPFKDAQFDCIYTCAVLEHCYDVDKIIADLDRLLKPGGFLVIGTPNLLSPFTRLSLVTKRLLGKRKRYHLYGTPGYLVRSIALSLKKGILRDRKLLYVNPDYNSFGESDEDVTFLSNHFDFVHMLKKLGHEIKELSRGESAGGKIVAKLFPSLSGEVLIVSKKKLS